MQNQSETASKKVDKGVLSIFTETPIWIVFLVFTMLVWVPLIVVLVGSLLSNDTAETGQIGDTIGGTTAPLVGILNAILVYHAFRQQLAANKLQKEAIESEQARYAIQSDFEILIKIATTIKEESQTLFYDNPSEIGVLALDSCMRGFLKKRLMDEAINITYPDQQKLFEMPIITEFGLPIMDFRNPIFKDPNDYQSMIEVFVSSNLPRYDLRSYTWHVDKVNILFENFYAIHTNIDYWCRRLQQSKMSDIDKSALAKVYMRPLHSQYFKFSAIEWFLVFFPEDEVNIQHYTQIDARIENLLHHYCEEIDL